MSCPKCDGSGIGWSYAPPGIGEALPCDECRGWYGTADHRRREEKIDEAREATWQDGYQEPPAGTFIPGVGEI